MFPFSISLAQKHPHRRTSTPKQQPSTRILWEPSSLCATSTTRFFFTSTFQTHGGPYERQLNWSPTTFLLTAQAISSIHFYDLLQTRIRAKLGCSLSATLASKTSWLWIANKNLDRSVCKEPSFPETNIWSTKFLHKRQSTGNKGNIYTIPKIGPTCTLPECEVEIYMLPRLNHYICSSALTHLFCDATTRRQVICSTDL